MTPEYLAICAAAAADLLTAMQTKPLGMGQVYVWAVPPDAATRRNGALIVGAEAPMGAPLARCVRPSDNGASTFGRWEAAPYSALASILATACRHDPVMPIYGATP